MSLEDEAFRLWVAAVKDKSKEGKWIWEKKVIDSSFRRSPKLQENVMQFVKMMNPNISGWSEPQLTLSLPPERAEKFLFRITKGFLTHLYPEYNFRKDTFKGYNILRFVPRHNQIISELIDNCTHELISEGVFEFWHAITMENNGGCWVYRFYDSAWLAVFHSNETFPVTNQSPDK